MLAVLLGPGRFAEAPSAADRSGNSPRIPAPSADVFKKLRRFGFMGEILEATAQPQSMRNKQLPGSAGIPAGKAWCCPNPPARSRRSQVEGLNSRSNFGGVRCPNHQSSIVNDQSSVFGAAD